MSITLSNRAGRWLTFVLLCLQAVAAHAQVSLVSTERPAEYMIYQYPRVAMVIRIEAPGAEIASEIYGPDQALLAASTLPESRIGPLYQYLPPPDRARQLMIKVTPRHAIPRSDINLQLIQLSDTDPNGARLEQAYGLLSRGMERSWSGDTSTWAGKSYTLRSAASVFRQMGWEEMRLWAEFYSAHLVLHRLGDELTALEFSRDIEGQAERIGSNMIRLAAMILQSESLVQAARTSQGSVAEGRYRSAIESLQRTIDLSETLGIASETSRALYLLGQVHEYQGQRDAAINRYRQALLVAEDSNNEDLANEIRSTAAVLYESMGSTEGALDMLDAIAAAPMSEEDRERVDSLYEKGRLLNKDFRYQEAIPVYQQALDLPQSAIGPARTLAKLELAWAMYSSGQNQDFIDLLDQPEAMLNHLPDPMPFARALGNLANVHRSNGDFGRMQRARDLQGEVLTDQQASLAAWYLQRGIDEWRRYGVRSSDALSLYQRAEQAANSPAQDNIRYTARLRLCLLKLDSGQGSACSQQQAESWLGSLTASALPQDVLEGHWLLSQIRQLQGNAQASRQLVEELIVEMEFLEHLVPGVLGAWYWEHRASIIRHYLDLSLSSARIGNSGYANGLPFLQAAEWVRTLSAPKPSIDSEQQSLRSIIGQHVASPGPASAERVSQALKAPREQFDDESFRPGASAIRQKLAALPKDSVLLNYYFSESGVYAMVADERQVRLKKLSNPDRIVQQLDALRNELAGALNEAPAQLDSLGALLLQPVRNQLRSVIFTMPLGPMAGVPMDSFRLSGRFLAEDHRVLNITSLDSVSRANERMPNDFANRVFVAGRPQDSQQLFNYEVTVSPEVVSMTSLFVGQGLHIVQGVALQPDEFLDPHYANAALVHVGTPGIIELEYPEQSRLRLSGSSERPDAGLLYPEQIRQLDQTARLVTLSNTEVRGSNRATFSHRVGLVADFMENGADFVMASLWIAEDAQTAAFVADFYGALAASSNVVEAWHETRRNRIQEGNRYNFRDWARFQLYIR